MIRRSLFAGVALALVAVAPLLAQVEPPRVAQPAKPPAIEPVKPLAPPGEFQPPEIQPFPGPGGPGFPPGFAPRDYKDVVPALIEVLSDTDKETRESASTALARVGRQAVKPLLDILKDKDKDIELRANVAYTLGKMGPTAQDAVPDLAKLLKDANRELRRRAAFALSNIIQDEMHGFQFGGFQGGFGGPALPLGGAGGGLVPPPPARIDPGVIGPKPIEKPPIEKPAIEKPPVEKPEKPIEK